jgi:hypothetical protein
MKRLIIVSLAAFLLLGCINLGGSRTSPQGPSVPDVIPDVSDKAECTPSSSFTGPDDGTFGKDSKLSGSVTCMAGSRLELKVGDEVVDSVTIQGNDSTTVAFDVPGIEDGTHEVSVMSGGSTLYSKSWEVSYLGNDDISGPDYDAFSYKQWRAMAFDMESPVDVERVSLYLKRLEGKTKPDTKVVVELRKDSSGTPGSLIAEAEIPIEETTLTYNWVHFDFSPEASLDEGTVWVVAKVEQQEVTALSSDVVVLHYETIDRLSDGNGYTAQMDLDVDEKTGIASETSWKALSFDREYNVILRG